MKGKTSIMFFDIMNNALKANTFNYITYLLLALSFISKDNVTFYFYFFN